jgi:hypothetical protein
MFGLSKIFVLLDLLRKGESLTNAATWKNVSTLTMVLSGMFVAIVQYLAAQGIQLPFGEAEATTVASAIAIVVGVFLNYATSDKVGILPPKD